MRNFPKVSAPLVLSAVLKMEFDPAFCRETETLTAGSSIEAGELVAKVGGKIVPWNPAGADGSQEVYGLSTDAAEAPVGVDNDLVQIVVRGPAILSPLQIPGAWSTATAPQKAAAIADLEAKNILVR